MRREGWYEYMKSNRVKMIVTENYALRQRGASELQQPSRENTLIYRSYIYIYI